MKKKIFSILALLCMAVTGAWAEEITIGDPTSTTTNAYLPSYSLYEYSLSQQIYTADEIGTSGTINALTMWLKNSSSYPRNYNIYMKEVSQSSFADGNAWVSMAESNLVATATLSNGITDPVETTFTLTTPFEYSGTGNLVICFQDVTGQWSSGVASVVMTTSGHQAIYAYRDGSLYDPTSPGVTGSFATKDSEGVKSVVKFDISASVVNKPFELTMAEDAEAHGTIIFKVNNVRTNPDDNGVVGVDVDDEVTVTITPDEGWVVNKPTGEWIAAFANAPRRVQDVDMDHFFDLTLVSENEETGAKTYTFTMNPANVEISCSYKQITTVAFPEEEYEAQFKEPFESPVAMTDPDDLPLVYSSSDESVATVDPQTGEVTFVNIGEVVITAAFEGNDNYEPAEDSYTIYIEHRVFTIDFTKEPNKGSVTLSAKKAIEYDEISVSVLPDAGYVITEVTVVTDGGETVEYTEAAGEQEREVVYIFSMPYDNVTVNVKFENKNVEGREVTTGDGNTYVITDPDAQTVIVKETDPDSNVIVIPATIYDEETGVEYTVTGVDNDAFEGRGNVTDVYVENEKDMVEIDGQNFVEDMPDAKLHVYQTLLGNYADAMPELLDGHKLVTDIENTDPEFTFSNATNVLLPEGVQQFICQYQTTSGNAPAVAAAPAAAIVKATLVPDQVVTAHNGVMLQGETGVKEYAAVKDAGNGNYEGNELKAIEKATVINHEHGAYMLEGKVWEHIWDEFVVIGDGKAILLVKDGTNLPDELEYVLDTTTGLEAIDNGQLTMDNCYTIQGYKVTKSQSNLPKGVYIVNGKKVVMK